MTLPIPVAALSQHVVALGKTGSGKSSKLRVLVEFQLEHEQPVTIVDRKGDWWGLKSSADGKGSGFPIVIFGGEHADVPINAHSGAHVAELVATGNRSALIDLSAFMVGEATRFWIDFAAAYFRLTRGARTLVLPEAHNFAPKGKVLDPDAGKALHWANRLASEGRAKGITILADSQRPQKVHNDFLTSCETLIACKVIHKADRDAIKDWIDGCADAVAGKQVIAELAQMQRTDAWCWSPEVEFGPKRITWPMFKTFDSFKPQPERAVKFTGWASVDLDDVKAKLAKVVEEAKLNDPKELRALNLKLGQKVLALEREARDLKAAPAHVVDPNAEQRGYERGWNECANKLDGVTDVILRQFQEARDFLSTKVVSAIQGARVKRYEGSAPAAQNPRRIPHPAPPRAAPAARNDAGPSGGGSLPKAERKVLSALSTYGECESGRLALLTGYTYSGGFRNILSSLRSSGFIEGENTGRMRITDAGEAQGPFDPLPQGEELREHWLNFPHFGTGERTVLAVLLASPAGMNGEALAGSCGYTYSGGFRNILSKLRTAGVLVGNNTGVMKASEELLR